MKLKELLLGAVVVACLIYLKKAKPKRRPSTGLTEDLKNSIKKPLRDIPPEIPG